MSFLLTLMLLLPQPAHWVRVRDAYAVHRSYRNEYGLELGGYYQPRQPSHQAVAVAEKFTAQCYQGPPREFATELEAKTFVVLSCPLF